MRRYVYDAEERSRLIEREQEAREQLLRDIKRVGRTLWRFACILFVLAWLWFAYVAAWALWAPR